MNSFLKKYIDIAFSDRWWLVSLAVILVYFSALRIIDIEKNPPADLSISAAPFTDEGLKTYSARNLYFHGKYKWTRSDGYSGWNHSAPLSTYIYLKWFKAFGVSIKSVRYINVIFSILTMVLLFILVTRYYNDRFSAFASVILFGSSYFLIMFNRLAFFENMLIFFSLLIFYSVCELFTRREKMKKSVTNKSIKTFPQFLHIIIAASIGCLATVAGIFTKQSIMVIVVAITPLLTLYIFYSSKKLNSYLINKFYITMLVLVIGYLLVGHFGWFDEYFKSLLKIQIFDVSLGYLLPLKQSFANFDPLYLSFLKSLYLEFVYLQPIIFFTGIFYAVKTYYNFLYKNKLNIIDAAFSTWFLFGFLFLAVMRYHPARYYLLLSIPLVILSARFFTSPESFSFSNISPKGKVISIRRFTLFIFWFYLFFYVGVIIVNTFTPFFMIKRTYEFVFYSYLQQNYTAIFLIALGLLLIQILVFVGMYYLVKKIRPFFNSKKYSYLIFLVLLLFQMFQYARWYTTNNSSVADFSKFMGENLPENTVLTGCWSASLALNSGLRSIVIQERLSYNTRLLGKIIDDDPLSTFVFENEEVVEVQEIDMPLFLFVSKTGPFDLPIRDRYKDYLTEERYMGSINLGLYDVEMYRLDVVPDAGLRNLFINYLEKF
jgi:hypothetical protein